MFFFLDVVRKKKRIRAATGQRDGSWQSYRPHKRMRMRQERSEGGWRGVRRVPVVAHVLWDPDTPMNACAWMDLLELPAGLIIAGPPDNLSPLIFCLAVRDLRNIFYLCVSLSLYLKPNRFTTFAKKLSSTQGRGTDPFQKRFRFTCTCVCRLFCSSEFTLAFVSTVTNYFNIVHILVRR